MHESARRLTCRLGFLLFCLLPTALVGGWILYCQTPVYHAARRDAWQSRLAALLGTDLQLDGVVATRQGTTLLENVRLSDPETGELMARARLVEIAQSDGMYKVLVSQPELGGRYLGRLWEVLHQRVLRGYRAGQSPLALAARELTIQTSRQSTTLTDVQCWIEASEAGPQATFDFRLAGLEMPEPAQFRVLRDRRTSPPGTGWVLHTGSTTLSCALLADYLPALRRMGADSRFQGSIWAALSAKGWQGDVSGDLLDLDLYNLVSEQFPHKLSGSGRVRLNVARFEEGRLLEASGELRCAEGVISLSLLDALQQSLPLSLNERLLARRAQQQFRFRELAFGFRLDQGGLSLSAVRDARFPGVVLLDGEGQWLLSESSRQSVPAVALVRALVPDSELLVPATRQTNYLLDALPVPPLQLPADTAERPLYAPLKLHVDDDST